jgi:hypothetical protein
MSTFGQVEHDVLRQAAQPWKNRKQDRLKKIEKAHDSKHKKRLESLTKQLSTGFYAGGPEFSSSIPTENSTIAPMVRGGFQSPSPPRTPPRRQVAGLVRTKTPVLVPTVPKIQLGDKFKPRTRMRGTRNITRRGRRRRTDQKRRAMDARRRQMDIDTDSDSEPPEILRQSDEKAWETETSSEQESDTVTSDWDPANTITRRRRKRGEKMVLQKEPIVTAIKNPTTNMAGFRALRARQKKKRQAKKRQRVNIRHNVGTHHPFQPKLQINQKGTGKFLVRATGISEVVENQVRALLARVKGKLFVNGKSETKTDY